MRSLGAVGRAALASAVPGGIDAQHRAYLQLLQERNHANRHSREQEKHKEQDRLKREAGFNVCFSGANAPARSASARQRDVARGLHFPGGGGSNEAEGVWRKWEDKTVEIKGIDGEVYAVRPTGERRDMQDRLRTGGRARLGLGGAVSSSAPPPALREEQEEQAEEADRSREERTPRPNSRSGADRRFDKDTMSPGSKDEEERGNDPLSKTQEDLRDICQQLVEDGLVDGAHMGTADGPQATATSTDTPSRSASVQGFVQGSSSLSVPEGQNSIHPELPGEFASPTAVDLAERIVRLSRSRRTALLKMLEEAEAEEAAEAELQAQAPASAADASRILTAELDAALGELELTGCLDRTSGAVGVGSSSSGDAHNAT